MKMFKKCIFTIFATLLLINNIHSMSETAANKKIKIIKRNNLPKLENLSNENINTGKYHLALALSEEIRTQLEKVAADKLNKSIGTIVKNRIKKKVDALKQQIENILKIVELKYKKIRKKTEESFETEVVPARVTKKIELLKKIENKINTLLKRLLTTKKTDFDSKSYKITTLIQKIKREKTKNKYTFTLSDIYIFTDEINKINKFIKSAEKSATFNDFFNLVKTYKKFDLIKMNKDLLSQISNMKEYKPFEKKINNFNKTFKKIEELKNKLNKQYHSANKLSLKKTFKKIISFIENTNKNENIELKFLPQLITDLKSKLNIIFKYLEMVNNTTIMVNKFDTTKFASIKELKEKIKKYIELYNKHEAFHKNFINIYNLEKTLKETLVKIKSVKMLINTILTDENIKTANKVKEIKKNVLKNLKNLNVTKEKKELTTALAKAVENRIYELKGLFGKIGQKIFGAKEVKKEEVKKEEVKKEEVKKEVKEEEEEEEEVKKEMEKIIGEEENPFMDKPEIKTPFANDWFLFSKLKSTANKLFKKYFINKDPNLLSTNLIVTILNNFKTLFYSSSEIQKKVNIRLSKTTDPRIKIKYNKLIINIKEIQSNIAINGFFELNKILKTRLEDVKKNHPDTLTFLKALTKKEKELYEDLKKKATKLKVLKKDTKYTLKMLINTIELAESLEEDEDDDLFLELD